MKPIQLELLAAREIQARTRAIKATRKATLASARRAAEERRLHQGLLSRLAHHLDVLGLTACEEAWLLEQMTQYASCILRAWRARHGVLDGPTDEEGPARSAHV